MNKKYIVELTDDERSTLNSVVKKLKGSSQKVKRANILLKADALRPGWTDAKIAEVRIGGNSEEETQEKLRHPTFQEETQEDTQTPYISGAVSKPGARETQTPYISGGNSRRKLRHPTFLAP